MYQTTESNSLIDQLSILAKEKSSEKRRELLGMITDLYFSDVRENRSDHTSRAFAEIVKRLLKEMNLVDRERYSSSISRTEGVPREVVMSLAQDDIFVSCSILRNSPVLEEDDLVAIAASSGTAHRMAVAERPDITVPVTDELLSHGEVEVARSLCENKTAKMSDDGFHRLSELSENEPPLLQSLSLRDDLPIDIALKILPHLDEVSAERLRLLLSSAGDGDHRLDAIMEQAKPQLLDHRLQRHRQRIKTYAIMSDVTDGHLTLDAGIGRVVDEGGALDVALALSVVSSLSEQQVANAVISVSGERLAVICKAVGLRVETYIRVDHLRTSSVNLPDAPRESLQASYDSIDLEAARKTLRFAALRRSSAGVPAPTGTDLVTRRGVGNTPYARGDAAGHLALTTRR